MTSHDDTIESVRAGLIVSIDGPSGSGKTTTASRVAERLGLRHIDTGAMYRSVTLAALERGIDLGDGAALGELSTSLDIDLDNGVMLDGRDVTAAIRSSEVTANVSAVSAHPQVRAAMVRLQRRAAASGGVVLEGRDIGSVVLPWADVKVYLDASIEARAGRRQRELAGSGGGESLEAVRAAIASRDERDTARETSPLVRPIGAWTVDTSEMTIDQQVDAVVSLVEETAGRLAELRVPDSHPGRPRRRRGIYVVSCFFLRVIMRLFFGLRIYRQHERGLEENYIVACNHKAYVDPPFMGSTIKRELYFMAKSGLFNNPLFAALIRYFNAMPVRRGVFDRDAMRGVADRLQSGRSLMIFPEGGRVLHEGLGRPKSGIGYLALTSGTAVLPVYISGSNHLMRCLFRRERMRVIHGSPIRIPRELLAAYQTGEAADAYRRFSEMVMHAISALRDELEDPTTQ